MTSINRHEFQQQAREWYELNKLSKVKSICTCPICGATFIKRNKLHTFCTNWYTDKYHDCKTQFWNEMDEVRRRQARELKDLNTSTGMRWHQQIHREEETA